MLYSNASSLPFSISRYPAHGPDLDAAYKNIVMDKVIPMYEKYNTSVTRQLVEYFSEIENREEIMQNFARFTLYVKDLTVQMTEEHPGYTELDLLSDIGENI